MLKKIFNKIIYLLLKYCGGVLLLDPVRTNYHLIKMQGIAKSLKSVCGSLTIGKDYTIMGHKCITIGENMVALDRLRIEAIEKYQGVEFTPEIIIGNNVIFNTDCHIGCINKVTIGNNVMFASRIYVSDHSHGEISAEALKLAPVYRKLVSAGEVIIKDNVWIGEGVCILPGVTIGENAIIGANAVVTKNIPDNAVAAGIPARVIKILN